MANPAPTINQINAFNATQGTTIDFNIIGGTELIRSNRIYIYDLSDNSLICTHLYVSTESIHELPPNTDGSIVYESGKSSADFVNGAQYYAQIQTYTDTNGTQGGSGLSVAKMFWCLGDPTLTITTIPSTISTTSYNISATYTDTSASVVSNIIQQYQFNLYSATGSLLQSSGVVVGSGTQQGTSAVYDISHNFTGLNVGSSYYVTVDVITTQGMSVTTQSNTFTVSIDTPTLGEATVVNNACDGYISVTSNLSGEYGGSGSGGIVSFETDSENVFSKLQVDLEPTQEGSGNPSPSNVRPIRGHSGVTVYDSPTQNAEDGESYSVDFNATLTPTSTDTTPYLFKAVGDVYGDRLEDKIVGGTVTWNQLAREITSTYWNATGQTAEANFNNGIFSCIAQSQSSGIINGVSYRGHYHTNHIYLRSAKIWVESGTGTFQFRIASGYGDLTCNVTTTPTIFSSVTKTPSDGALDISITDKRTEGFTRMYIEDIQVFDLTQMFGSTIADYIYSLEQSQAGAGVAWFKKLFPNDYYAYNAGELLSVEGLSAHVMRDADNSVIGNYPLDSSLTLRGIPKLDASNNLYYDGDEYTSDGKVKRKYGIVDLGTLDWRWNSTYSTWNSNAIENTVKTDGYTHNMTPPFICNTYEPISMSKLLNESVYGRISYNPAYGNMFIKMADNSVQPSGTLVYELATPTTETAQAYTNPQIVSKYGTIEYVTNSIVPVGHKTTYLTKDIFGGYVDLISGMLVVDKVMVDLGSLNWTLFSASRFWVMPSGMKPFTRNLMSSQYAEKSVEVGSLNDGEMTTQAGGGEVYIKDTRYTTATEFKSAVSGQQLVYELETPQTYQLTPQQVYTLVGTNNVWSDSGQVEVRIAESMRDVDTLTRMPLSIKVAGAGDGGITTVVVERAEDYLMVRPDETNFNGNKGEMVLQTSPPLVGINQVSFNTDDLIGPMDDGAVYNIVATVQDGLGQKDSVTLPFEVHWEHQAEEPSAEIVIDEENLIAYIKPIAPANADPEDVADIYRLSADKPELIVEGAIFGETYVDPYPALGDMGGHRIVTRTKNGDYITEGNQIAMIDSPELGVNPIENEDLLNVIDFEGRQIRFYWETDYSNTWAKDFQETTYLGGSIEGDWNPAVSRSGTLSSKAITVLDQEMLKDVRRLADYPGICHVRTADGSSYAADVQVSEDYADDEKGMVTNYSLSITKVGSQGFDGMTKEQWDDENPVEGGE